MAKKPKKKKKKSFQQEIREKQKQTETAASTEPVILADDLDSGTRIGFILMSYLLFIVGSIGCLIMGFAGRDRRGSGEVLIIGFSAVFLHAFIILCYYVNTKPSIGIPPIVPIAILAAFPVICIIAGFATRNQSWSAVVKTIGLALLIPHYIALAAIIPRMAWDEIERKEIQVKNNVLTIQNAVDHYAYENENQYPDDIQTLIDKGYMKIFPGNPLSDDNVPMREIEFTSSGKEGNFSYIAVTSKGETINYYLIGYGANNQEFSSKPDYYKDVDKDGTHDNVVIVLKGNTEGLSETLPLKKLLK